MPAYAPTHVRVVSTIRIQGKVVIKEGEVLAVTNWNPPNSQDGAVEVAPRKGPNVVISEDDYILDDPEPNADELIAGEVVAHATAFTFEWVFAETDDGPIVILAVGESFDECQGKAVEAAVRLYTDLNIGPMTLTTLLTEIMKSEDYAHRERITSGTAYMGIPGHLAHPQDR